MKVLDYMNRNPQNVGVEISVKDVILLIYKNKIGSIHVIDKTLVGIISILNMLALFIDLKGAKLHRLWNLHRAFLLRPLPDPRKHILST
jgi:CBS domain-containing protein